MIAQKLADTIKQFNINNNQILQLISENGSNMIKAARVSQKVLKSRNKETDDDSTSEDSRTDAEDENPLVLPENIPYKRLPCLAHCLQLVVKVLDKNELYNGAMLKARELSKKIRMFSVATQKFIKRCSKPVMADCPTRWNSSFLMVQRLLEIKASIGK